MICPVAVLGSCLKARLYYDLLPWCQCDILLLDFCIPHKLSERWQMAREMHHL